ncbi:MAG TPA: GNAT family protein [Conexibacter sp.]|jgi:aminoglycoside 6'-N-acetyltransferase|nr:GNAT family protein [Conexibacter sp.]
MDELPVVESARLTLRPAREADVAALLEILAEPDVLTWWGRYDAARVLEELPGTYAIVVGGAVAGWLQVHEEAEPDYPSVAFDIVVATRLRGGGYGREALRAAIGDYAARGHHRFTIDPSTENERAIRAYAAIGFKPVGVLRRYERAPDGRWRDGLLMDLLADELVE